MSACIRQTAASHSKFSFTPTFIFCSSICPNNCGVLLLWKCILVFEKWFFSYDHSNMQIFTVKITRVVWPHVTWGYALVQFCYSKKIYSCLYIPNCTRNHVITYTYITPGYYLLTGAQVLRRVFPSPTYITS